LYLSIKKIFADWFPITGIAAALISTGVYLETQRSTRADVDTLQALQPAVTKQKVEDLSNDAELDRQIIGQKLDRLNDKIEKVQQDVAEIKGRLTPAPSGEH